MTTCPICDYEFEDSQSGCPRHRSQNSGDAAGAGLKGAEAMVGSGSVIGSGTKRKAETPEAQALIGTTLNALYNVDEIIGKGAMGTVYKAFQAKDNRAVALKVLHTHLAADPESIKRFHYEARAASSLLHSNIVRIHDVGLSEAGQPYIVMELLDGITLSQFLKDRHYLRTHDALPIMRQACEALAEAHSHGVLHRDIKPANIMLCNRFGMDNFVLVLDFSIAKIIQKVSDVDSTTPGMIFGSPTYMSPERFMGKGGDFRSDIYAMGVIMFQMLAGRPPFKSSDIYTLMNEHISSPTPRVKDFRPDSDVPELLEDVIARALAKKPEDRQENMKKLLAEVNEIYNTIRDTRPDEVLETELAAHRTNVGQRPDNSFFPDGVPSSFHPAIPAKPVDKSSISAPFEINPGGSGNAPSSSATPVSPGSATPNRKVPTLEENTRQKNTPDFNTSGRWDKSLISKHPSGILETLPAQRQRIRPVESTKRVPLELVALVAVLLAFLWVIAPRIIPPVKKAPPTQSAPNAPAASHKGG